MLLYAKYMQENGRIKQHCWCTISLAYCIYRANNFYYWPA